VKPLRISFWVWVAFAVFVVLLVSRGMTD